MNVEPAERRRRLGEVIRVFFKLGLTGFGGPAAHIAMMREEVVRRRKWLSDDELLDLLGATNLIPGPNSTEMAIHLGYLRAGGWGLIAAGVAFILPAMAIVLAMAWAYVRYESLPETGWLLYGIKPVVLALIVHALWILGRRRLRRFWLAVLAVVVLGLSLAGVNEIVLLLGGGLVALAAAGRLRIPPALSTFPGLALGLQAATGGPAGSSLLALFLTFLKIGSVLYGSGYVLLAFLRADFVTRLGWLTDRQLLDAIAVGQVTPGPLFTSATFIGYLVGGLPGGLLGTLGIFLPSFIFVLLSRPLLPRLRASRALSAALDGVTAASLGLMAAVALQVAAASIIDLPTAAIGAASAGLLAWGRVNPTWLIVAAGALGLAVRLLGVSG
jgi:chromate transporter